MLRKKKLFYCNIYIYTAFYFSVKNVWSVEKDGRCSQSEAVALISMNVSLALIHAITTSFALITKDLSNVSVYRFFTLFLLI